MLIECTGYDRPALFASATMMQPQATGRDGIRITQNLDFEVARSSAV